MAIVTTESGNYAAIAAAIRSKNGEETKYKPGEMAAAIEAIKTGGGATKPLNFSDVNFVDYDGTLLYAYTFEEAQALEALPEPPEHEGLVFDGWNWALSEIKSSAVPVIAGALYTTDNGETRLHVKIVDPNIGAFTIQFKQTVSGGVLVNWGDDLQRTESTSGTGFVEMSHTYAKPGDYVIALRPQGSCSMVFGGTSYPILGDHNSTYSDGAAFSVALKSINFGENVTNIDSNAFEYLIGLETISMPEGIVLGAILQEAHGVKALVIPRANTTLAAGFAMYNTTLSPHPNLEVVSLPPTIKAITAYAFSPVPRLKAIAIPGSVSGTVNMYAIQGSFSLQRLEIPEGVTTISMNAFLDNKGLTVVTLPSTLTSLDINVFKNCYALTSVYVKSTKPPKINASTTFSGCDNARFYVPAQSVNTYKSETNWAQFADRIEAIS